MILTFFALLLFNSLYCIGFYKACSVEFVYDDEPKRGVIPETKMILWWVKYLSVRYLGKFWSKPICTCPPCMASVHSLYVYIPLAINIFKGRINPELITLTWPIFAFALVTVNWVMINIIETIESYIERN